MKCEEQDRPKKGSRCGSLGRAIASDTTGPWFKFSDRGNIYIEQFLLSTVWKNENNEKETGNGLFKKGAKRVGIARGKSIFRYESAQVSTGLGQQNDGFDWPLSIGNDIAKAVENCSIPIPKSHGLCFTYLSTCFKDLTT